MEVQADAAEWPSGGNRDHCRSALPAGQIKTKAAIDLSDKADVKWF
jgi:hypothetical protein